jgi:hypothetical protein
MGMGIIIGIDIGMPCMGIEPCIGMLIDIGLIGIAFIVPSRKGFRLAGPGLLW